MAMGRSVRELLATIDSRELAEWMAMDAIDPLDPARSDVQAAIVACTMANAFRSRKRPYDLFDFMPFADKPQQTPEQQMQIFRDLAAGFEARSRRDQPPP